MINLEKQASLSNLSNNLIKVLSLNHINKIKNSRGFKASKSDKIRDQMDNSNRLSNNKGIHNTLIHNFSSSSSIILNKVLIHPRIN